MTEQASRTAPPVNRVWPLAEPDGESTSCSVCDETIPANACWRVTLSGTGVVLTCGRCADHARRHGHLHIGDGTHDSNGDTRPHLTIQMSVLETLEGDLVEGNAHVFDSPDSYAAGVRDALEHVTRRGDE